MKTNVKTRFNRSSNWPIGTKLAILLALFFSVLSPVYSSTSFAAVTAVITDPFSGDATKYAEFPIFFDALSSTLGDGDWDGATVKWTFSGSAAGTNTGTLAPFGVSWSLENTQYGRTAAYLPQVAGTLTVKLEVWSD